VPIDISTRRDALNILLLFSFNEPKICCSSSLEKPKILVSGAQFVAHVGQKLVLARLAL